MPIENITVGMIVGKDIVADGGSVALVREMTVLTTSLIELLCLHDIRFAYILDESNPAPAKKKTAEPPNIYVPKPKPIISPQLRQDAVKSLEDIFKEASLGAADVHASTAAVVKSLDNVVDRLVDSLDGQSIVNIMDLKSYDDYTFHHSLSVAVLSVAVAQQMGFSQKDLRRIGKSAMMHDIGKTSVPIEIIHKPARLDPGEFKIVKNHCPAGYYYLSQTVAGDEELWNAVLFHHEKVDGTGYPFGLKQDDIPMWSRIISVADVYDALTSNRPYRTPMQPGEAIEYVMGSVGRDFDFDVVESFMKKVELYPIGSRVLLSNGKTAVVCDNENSMRPVVKVIPTGELLDLFHDRACLSIVITRSLND